MQWYDDVARFHPQWNVINRYIDQGITGTQVYKRDAFMQMMEDAVVDTLIQWRDGFMNIVYSQETDRQHFDIASKINLSCILTGFTLTDEETSNQDRYIAEFTSDSGG
ncbi:Resolvase domain protein [human gut metagenome]|uniref:Resolvase domain protein n=2 Tax=human gut metagenome TaxID=408170 RepID=K1SJF7_9ZZZZ